MPALIPELTVTDIEASKAFYLRLGWRIAYKRPEERFAMMEIDGPDGPARLMLDALSIGRNFDATPTATDRPFGRGVNFEIETDRIEKMLSALDSAKIPLHLPAEDAWYRVGDHLAGQRQFIVADPDGYLLRFVQSLGERLIAAEA